MTIKYAAPKKRLKLLSQLKSKLDICRICVQASQDENLKEVHCDGVMKSIETKTPMSKWPRTDENGGEIKHYLKNTHENADEKTW